ncbi:MAG: insulinase family protein [Rhodobacteraceae bacterium]|nr:insulinase family protein [Paracoccaceae bacterium]
MKLIWGTLIAAVMAVPAWAEIKIQQVQSPGGISAWLVQEPSIPFVSIEIMFEGGASLDLPGKRGATYLMTGLLEEGAADLDARGFAREVEALAAQFSYDVSDDYVSVSAKFLTENRDQAVDLLRKSLIEPAFDEASIARVRAQVISGLRSDLTDPDEIVARRFKEIALAGHPYGTAYEGTQDSVSSLTRDDLVTAHSNALVRDRVYVGAAGDISAEDLSDLMDELLGDLPLATTPLPDRIDPVFDGGVTVVPFDTPQSVAQFGHIGIARDDPDFFPAYVLNVILGGGGFEARLMTEVREKRGLTYGVYSYLVPKNSTALYLGRVASANDRIAEAIEVIRTEWERAATEGVTADELARAKTYLTGAYPLRFDGNGPIANILVGMQTQDLSPEYIVTRNDSVNAVTLDDIKRVAARLLQPENLSFVVVGQPVGLDSEDQPQDG